MADAGGTSLVASRGGRLEGRLEASGARLIRLPVHSKNPLTMAANASRLAAVIKRDAVSLLHVRSRAPAFSALSAARATNIPLIATYHGVYAARSALKRWYNAIMTRGDVVIANSTFTAAHVLAEHGLPAQKVAIVPEGIDASMFSLAAVSSARVNALRESWGVAPGERRFIVLCPARLTSLKGHAVLIEALAGLNGREQVLLILAGEEARRGFAMAIEAEAAVAGLGDQVRLVGQCDDMPAAYAICDLVVVPSLVAESFGRTAVEAGAMSRPVIASALGGPAETVIDGLTGWLAPPGDAAGWTSALAMALSTPGDRLAAMGAAARERVLRFYSLPAMCEATFRVYRGVLEGRA